MQRRIELLETLRARRVAVIVRPGRGGRRGGAAVAVAPAPRGGRAGLGLVSEGIGASVLN